MNSNSCNAEPLVPDYLGQHNQLTQVKQQIRPKICVSVFVISIRILLDVCIDTDKLNAIIFGLQRLATFPDSDGFGAHADGFSFELDTVRAR